MAVIPDGRLTRFKEAQPPKTPSGSSFTQEGMESSVRPVMEKAYIPIVFTVSGRTRDRRFLQFAKAWMPRSVRPSGRVTLLRRWQSRKA